MSRKQAFVGFGGYPFKTKHLKYYLLRSQSPVFLFLINVTNREGNWLFAQNYLRQKLAINNLKEQKTFIVHFGEEDNLANFEKFKFLLSEAEQSLRVPRTGIGREILMRQSTPADSVLN
jgi:hypothetical protein